MPEYVVHAAMLLLAMLGAVRGFAPTTVESKLPGHLVCDDSDVVPDEKVHDFIDQCKLSIPNGTVGLHLPLCPGPDGSKILPCTNCTGIWGNADPTTGTVWVEGCCAWPAPIICPGDLSPITDPNEITKFVQTMFPLEIGPLPPKQVQDLKYWPGVW